ncbi:very-short-patch-repair endonuclease [Arthrobacter stackebrandtii]|uniref:Very-short-patch-repair endonuclease n=1 Tax=Arthrobacter stackebrandtii TaxID=272161 RepID=A0ABS4YSH8_9MICC|nr:DUF3320 domain-containing protein [Arthrobacter stackebrandtii]MBP2411736.1 very-short-patch-repair endonuclease [Arthrobacter stackebrandtii]
MDVVLDEATAVPARLQDQMKAWREDLLALDRRQRLLYFQHPKVGSLEFLLPDMTELESWLESGPVNLAANPVGAAGPAPRKRTATVQDKNESEILATCRRLHQRSEQEYADRGVWILYVGLGMLNWVDPDDGKPASSPLKLVPVRLQRHGTRFRLRRTGDEAVVNSSLALKLQRDFGLALPEFDDPDFTVEELVAGVREAIAGEPGWTVDGRSILSPFTFHKEAMYQDLAANEERIMASPLIQAMALGPDAGASDTLNFELADDAALDELVPPETLHNILDADASQRRCIIAAREGRSFVMDGPPGTGKSQTIANIIAELMAVGKTVLFVSEKAAALDVVRDRLTAQKLGPFLLELHSHKATRKQVVETLAREMTHKPVGRSSLDATELSRLETSRLDLSGYATAMNELREPLGRSLHAVLGRLLELAVPENYTVGRPEDFAQLDAELLGEIQRKVGELSRAWRPAEEGEDFLWRGLASPGTDAAAIRAAAGAALAVAEQCTPLVDAALRLDARLPFLAVPMSRAGIRQRQGAAELIASRPDVPDHWLTGDFAAVEQCAAQWRDNLAARATMVETIGASFIEWTPADGPAALNRALADGRDMPVPGGLGQLTVAQALALREQLHGAAGHLRALLPDSAHLAGLFQTGTDGLSLRKVGVLCELAQLSRIDRRPEADWLDPAVHASLEESVRVLGGAVDAVRQLEIKLRDTFTPAVLELDLQALKHRFETEHNGFFSRWSAAARADRALLRPATPHGVVNKETVAALPDAIAWQGALARLYDAERSYGPRLKSHYQGLQTDFSRVRAAIDMARQASVLAGDDVDLAGLAAQLSNNYQPDRLLLPVAGNITARTDKLAAVFAASLDIDFQGWAVQAPITEALARTASFAAVLDDAEPALARLSAMGAASLTLDGAAAALEAIAGLGALDAKNDAGAAADSALLGRHFAGLETDWEALGADLAWCREARPALQAPLDEAALALLGGFTAVGLGLEEAAAAWDGAVASLAALFDGVEAAGLAEILGRDVAGSEALARHMHDVAATDIDAWNEFRRLRDWAAGHGLGEVVAGLERAGAQAVELPAALERAALEPWLAAVAAADARLADYRAGNRDALVQEFRALDEKLIRHAYSSVVAACTARRPRSMFGAAAVIVREAQKKARHKPIRTILEQAGEVAQALKPCFMMSPLAVSQYLPGDMRFDVVIFDEASQVRPADAVNCIYRGSQLIVAGDQKQLPPTSFFTTALDEPDDGPDSFDSVLDLCKASGAIASLPLSWHYRSMHEDLISYSNFGFYEGRLNTFPGAVHASPDLGVHHEFVPGMYLRGAGATNPVEAERVVDLVIGHRINNPGLSLGVVTFSTAQADAIFDAIERRSVAEPALAGLLEDRDRLHGFFVKNLESVQGDERDIIIFSVGYGPDANGKLDMNFGPLTRKGGQRRLNVAITRARRRVEIVSSFRAADMREGTSEGNRHLRNYLDFAARGTAALPAAAETAEPGDFLLESQVRAAVESLGYKTVARVGSAAYRVDIGVLHPSLEGTFLLGVECDGGAYSSAKTARDRDRLRGAVLGNLGWTMARVWGLAWHRDPAGGLARLKSVLDAALAAASAVETSGGTGTAPHDATAAAAEPAGLAGVPAVGAVEETGLDFEAVDLFTAPDWSIDYKQARYKRGASAVQPGSPEALPELIAFCEKVLAVEAPLHLDLLQARLRATWGVGSIGSRIKANLLEALARTTVNGVGARLDNDSFIRLGPPGPVAVRRSGPGGVPRRASAIAPEEFDEALRLILRDSMGSTEEQVVAALRSVFSWQRTGPDIQAAASRSIYRSVRNGVCEKDPQGVYRLAE